MMSKGLWLLCAFAFAGALSMPTSSGLSDEAKKPSEQTTRPKVKRAQELLMFGNQQNRQATDNSAANNFSPSAEKRTLSNSGLDDVSAALTEVAEQQQQQQQQQQMQQMQQQAANRPKAMPGGYIMDQPYALPSHEKNYEYGKVLVNEIGDVLPRGAWELPSPYMHYGYAEDRRKRSDEANAAATGQQQQQQTSPASGSGSSTAAPSIAVGVGAAHVAAVPANGPSQPSLAQPKRLAYYQEPRYKRELDVDPEDFIALLSLYDERRNRGNWRNFGNNEYDLDDDSNMIGLDDEDPRVTGTSWLDTAVYPSQQHHYLTAEPLLTSADIAALAAGRASSRPSASYYEQYLQQYGGGGGGSTGSGSSGAGQQQYDTGVQYGTPQYALAYGQHPAAAAYYPPEKRFMVSRKRSQNYDSYGGRNGLLLNSRSGYPSYQHRMFY